MVNEFHKKKKQIHYVMFGRFSRLLFWIHTFVIFQLKIKHTRKEKTKEMHKK